MANTVWGIRLNPGDTYPYTKTGLLTLNQVSLLDNAVEGRTTLQVKAKGHTFCLSTLVKNTIEFQKLSHAFIAEDEATFILTGKNSVQLMGVYQKDADEDEYVNNGEGSDEEEERETISGQPFYSNYLSDLLGPDLPEDEDDDYEDMDEDQDDFGTLAFRDPTDNFMMGGFELRHFNLAPQVPGFEKLDLRAEEKDLEDTLLNDNIAKGLVNALINSGDDFQIKKGKEMLKKLKKQCKQRKST